MSKMNKELFKKAAGVNLDVGCGHNKQPGFLGMDMMDHENVDIIHDIQEFPWPVPDNICARILLSHVWEHVEPKYRFQLMEELWRIIRHDGELFIACPYAGSAGEAAHPAHYMCPNDVTFQFFDPSFRLYHACSYKKPLPWELVRCDPNVTGNIEIILHPRKTPEGEPEETELGSNPHVSDAVKTILISAKKKKAVPGDDVHLAEDVKAEIVNKKDKK
jgi:SAM-dependent methyltransferase